MTTLLERAFIKAAQSPVEQQNVVASLLFREMESEELWAEVFAKSQDMLATLADETLEEIDLCKR
ncbi:MAG: hypothetical protein JST85_22680 [Acidobacteria bacterium]|nr:hypothetical protein [Acidobacteriota bacterium]